MRQALTAALLCGLCGFGLARRALGERLPSRLPPRCTTRVLVQGPRGFEGLACGAEIDGLLRAAGRPEGCAPLGTLRDGAQVELPQAGACDAEIGRMAGPALRLLGLPIDVNRGSLEDLEALPGIGPKMALRIQEGRPYHAIADLAQVSGIGPKRLAALGAAAEVGGW